MSDEEVWYHGVGGGTGSRPVVIENATGQVTGTVHHVPKHSPTGMSWGYAGSGPADTARSLLIAVLGDEAKCPECSGTQRIGWDRIAQKDVPYDPDRAGDFEPETVGPCWCEGGYRSLPYQDFKAEIVARWGQDWRMSRSDILTWLSMHQDWRPDRDV